MITQPVELRKPTEILRLNNRQMMQFGTESPLRVCKQEAATTFGPVREQKQIQEIYGCLQSMEPARYLNLL